AADATAARIMSHDPARVTQLVMGYEMGLGEIREDRIELIGANLSDLRVSWSGAQLRNQLQASVGGCPLFSCGRRAATV
ncbi:MAG: hypothetical protein AMS18_07710, partial [Gemmatimonas sp. SG8_17]